MTRRFRILVLLSVVIAGAVATLALLSGEPGLSADQRQLALSGVASNADWAPVTRRFHGIEMALVPAGCFTMGSTDPQLQEAIDSCDAFYGTHGCQDDFSIEQPAHQVCLSEPFWIDVVPVTNFQHWLVSKSMWPSPYSDLNLPVQAIPWQAAQNFCASRGGRLPTEAEWEFAARGPDALIYPYGNDYDLHLTTLRKISPPAVGRIPEGASWVGALDMSGGMAEWIHDWYGPYSSNDRTDPQGPLSGSQRILRGGDWFAHASFTVRAASREAIGPDFATSKNGFRCARDF